MIDNNHKIIFVPSSDINPLDDLLGTRTLLRCEEALKLWKKSGYDFIITSGGIYCNRKTQTVPAADLMKEWLILNGVDKDKILSEDKSLDTYTNIHYSIEILKGKNIDFKNFVVVSHWTHLIRIKLILWRNYKIKPVCVPVKYRLSLVGWLHEIIWFCYHLIDKTGYGFPERRVRKFLGKRTGPGSSFKLEP